MLCGFAQGDRYMMKLFRDYVFHQVDTEGQLISVAEALARGGDGSVALDGGAIRTAGGDVYEVVRLKNRFSEPLFNGYRDALYSVRVQIAPGVWHVCEMQLHLRDVRDLAREQRTHAHYEYFRSYFAGNRMGAADDAMHNAKADEELEELHASSSPMHESEIDSEPVPERDAAVSRGAETAAAVVPPSTGAADDRGELSEASEPEQRARTRRDRRRPRTPRRDRLIWATSVLIAGSASAARDGSKTSGKTSSRQSCRRFSVFRQLIAWTPAGFRTTAIASSS